MPPKVAKNSSADVPMLRIRRCHVCGTVNEVELSEDLRSAGDQETTQSCCGCGKHLAPFLFFEESVFEGVNVDGLFLSSLSKEEGYRPLWGFLAFWPEEGQGLGEQSESIQRQSGRRTGGTK